MAAGVAIGGAVGARADGPMYLYALGTESTYAFRCFDDPDSEPQCACKGLSEAKARFWLTAES